MRDRQQSILNGTHTESGKVEKTRGLKAILDSSTPTTSTTIAGGKTAASSKVKAVSKVATKRKRTAGVAFASSDAHDLPMELAILTPPPSSLQPSAATSSTTTVVSGTASNHGQKVTVGKRGRLTKTARATTTSSSSSTSQQHDSEIGASATTTTSYTSAITTATSEIVLGQTLDKTILWAVGWDRFYQEERHRLCLTLVRERMGVIAGDVIKCMLDISLATEGKRNEPYSCRMSVDDIYYQMNKLPSTATATSSSASATGAVVAAVAAGAAVTASVDRATLSSVLEIMRLDGVRILTKVRLHINKFTVNYMTLILYSDTNIT